MGGPRTRAGRRKGETKGEKGGKRVWAHEPGSRDELRHDTFINHRQTDWASLLPTAEFSHNTRAHAATKTSPFKLVYGYEPQFAILPALRQEVPAADTRIETLEAARSEAQALLEVAADRMKVAYDRHVRDIPRLEPGDLVWLDARNVSITRTRKLADRRLGPFKVKEKVSNLSYRLELPSTMRIHNVFHISLLSPFFPDEIEGRTQPPPPPVIVEEEEEYEVAQILDSGRVRGKLHYLVRWKGYSPSEDSWEPAELLNHAQEEVSAFYSRHPEAIRDNQGSVTPIQQVLPQRRRTRSTA